MGSLAEEQLIAGVLYLYGAISKNDYYSRLDTFFSSLLDEPAFSVLVPGERSGVFFLEHSTLASVDSFKRPRVESPLLAKLLEDGGDYSFSAGDAPTIEVAELTLPVVQVKPMSSDSAPLGLLTFHVPPEARDEELSDFEDYIFDHAAVAFRQMHERDLLSDRLQVCEVKLEAVGEFGDLLGQLDLETLLAHLLAVSIRLTGAQVGSVLLADDGRTGVDWGLPSPALEGFRGGDGVALVDRVLESGQACLVKDYAEAADLHSPGDFHVTSFLCAPLASKSRVLGTVNLVNADAAKGGLFTDTDMAAVGTICSLAATAIENAILHRDLIEKERIEASLEVAHAIQLRMFPARAFEFPGYELTWLSRSCDETGGDYFDFVPWGKDSVSLIIGDVSGHGMGAALLMATGRALLRALLTATKDLKEVTERLNDLLGEDMGVDKFMTGFLGRLNYLEHTLDYVNAGHDPPLFYCAERGEVEELSSTGTPLGMFAGVPYDRGRTRRMMPGDLLVLSTDGIWESRNAAREHYGKRRLERVLIATAGERVERIVETIVSDVEQHLAGVPPQDDLTLAVLRRTR